MFASLIHRAQSAVDNAVEHVVNRTIVAVPFLVAAGFATAAAYLQLETIYGAMTATLVMASAYAVIGVLAFLIVGPPGTAKQDQTDGAPDSASAERSSEQTTAPSAPTMSQADKDLLFAALTSAAPVALPAMVRLVLRNLPIVVAILAALFLLTRTAEEPSGAAEATPN
jgi:hypothetical protein